MSIRKAIVIEFKQLNWFILDRGKYQVSDILSNNAISDYQWQESGKNLVFIFMNYYKIVCIVSRLLSIIIDMLPKSQLY